MDLKNWEVWKIKGKFPLILVQREQKTTFGKFEKLRLRKIGIAQSQLIIFFLAFSFQMLNTPSFSFSWTPLWMFMFFLALLNPLKLCLKHPHPSSSSWLTKRRVTWKDTCFCLMWKKVSFMSERCGMWTFLRLNKLSLILVSACRSWLYFVVSWKNDQYPTSP